MSAPTLRRIWGYQEREKGFRPRVFTLDLLAQFVGYRSWTAFDADAGSTESEPLNNNCIYPSMLKLGEELRLMWNPDRCVTIRFMGQDMFEVVESVNSKLKVGSRFTCGCFIDGEPCYLNRLIEDNGQVTNYVCGRINGVKFYLLNREG